MPGHLPYWALTKIFVQLLQTRDRIRTAGFELERPKLLQYSSAWSILRLNKMLR